MSLAAAYFASSVFVAALGGVLHPRLGFALMAIFIASDFFSGRYGP